MARWKCDRSNWPGARKTGRSSRSAALSSVCAWLLASELADACLTLRVTGSRVAELTAQQQQRQQERERSRRAVTTARTEIERSVLTDSACFGWQMAF